MSCEYAKEYLHDGGLYVECLILNKYNYTCDCKWMRLWDIKPEECEKYERKRK